VRGRGIERGRRSKAGERQIRGRDHDFRLGNDWGFAVDRRRSGDFDIRGRRKWRSKLEGLSRRRRNIVRRGKRRRKIERRW
jgi:hypothetical protein